MDFKDTINHLHELIHWQEKKLESKFMDHESPVAERIRGKIKELNQAIEILKKNRS